MMANPADIIKTLLVSGGVGTFAATSGWGIFIGREPSKPTTSITIFNSGGRAPSPKWLLDFPSIQLIVRGAPNRYQDAYTKMRQAYDVLLGADSQDILGDRLVSITAIGSINTVAFDDDNRPVLSLNLNLIIEPAASVDTNRLPIT